MTVVELLHVEDCPNAAAYLPHLRELLAGAGVAAPVRTRVITDSEDAYRERFLGSPTVRVDGHDVDPDAAARGDYGLSCRVYPSAEGLRGTPPDRWVLAAVRPRGEPSPGGDLEPGTAPG